MASKAEMTAALPPVTIQAILSAEAPTPAISRDQIQAAYQAEGLSFPFSIFDENNPAGYAGQVSERMRSMARVRERLVEMIGTAYGRGSEAFHIASGLARISGPLDRIFLDLAQKGAPDGAWSMTVPQEASQLQQAVSETRKYWLGRGFSAGGAVIAALDFLNGAVGDPKVRFALELAAKETYKNGFSVVGWFALEEEFLRRINSGFRGFEPGLRVFLPFSHQDRELYDGMNQLLWTDLLSLAHELKIEQFKIRGNLHSRATEMTTLMAGYYTFGAGADILATISGESAVPRMIVCFPNIQKNSHLSARARDLCGAENNPNQWLRDLMYVSHEQWHCYAGRVDHDISELVSDLGYCCVVLPLLAKLPPSIRDRVLRSFYAEMLAEHAHWFDDPEMAYHLSSVVILNMLVADKIVSVADGRLVIDTDARKLQLFVDKAGGLLGRIVRKESGLIKDRAIDKITTAKPRRDTKDLVELIKS